MWLPLLAMIVGFVVVLFFQIDINPSYTEYFAIAVIAGLDSIIGAIHSGFEKKFNDRVFVSGFFANIIIACGLLYLGNQLSIPYIGIAIVVALIIRIFNNVGYVRRAIVTKLELKKIKAEVEEQTAIIESSLEEVSGDNTEKEEGKSNE